jgi:flagellar protein FliS
MLPAEYVQREARAQIASADRARLLLLVLEGGRTHLVRARDALEGGDVQAFAAALGRAHEVVAELLVTLDHAAGGAIAANLSRLWRLTLHHLALANAERSAERLDEVLHVYVPIVDAFRQVIAGPSDESTS